MAMAVDVGYPADALSEIRQSHGTETAVRQDTKAEPYLLWYSQPVKVAEEHGDVFGTPRRVHESSGGVED